MVRKLRKILILALISLVMIACLACGKKKKRVLYELDKDGNPIITTEKIAPGVHPERGTDSNAVPVFLAPIYYPTGAVYDSKKRATKQVFKKFLFELEKLTPEALDEAMKSMNLISEDSLFVDFTISESNEVISGGPGSSESMITKKGVVRYCELSTEADNSESYEGKTFGKDLEGMITMEDIIKCIAQTYEENFQLVSCDVENVDYDEYLKVHKK